MGKANSISPNAYVGLVFLMMGIVMSITAGFTFGMSFLMTGFVFLFFGLSSAGEPKRKDVE